MIRVLFVCLGNICRSPLAEAIFLKLCNEMGCDDRFTVDSAGTASYHIGKLPDSRSRSVALKHGIKLTHRARAFTPEDFNRFNVIVAMDEQNMADIKHLQPPNTDSLIVLMRQYQKNAKHLNVPDPYYGTIKDFEEVYAMLDESCRGLIKSLLL